ncbi:MAG: hypothetical protein ABIG28_01935 [archaeon]
MKTYKLTKEDRELIGVAKKVIKANWREDRVISSSTGAALVSGSGNVHKEINMGCKSSTSCSICAEMGAVAQMISNGERKINSVVAVVYWKGRSSIWQPCGACRHLVSQFGNPFVIISKTKKVRLDGLYPLPVR